MRVSFAQTFGYDTMARYNDCLHALNKLQLPSSQRNSQRRSASAKVRTRDWLKLLGIGDEQFQTIKFIHIAGTKGKGTTALYCDSLLSQFQRKSGKYMKLGCLTSPHLSDVRERIRLDSAPISKELFAQYFSEVHKQIHNHSLRANLDPEAPTPSIPGYPGFLALLGLYVFVKEKVEIAVIETGMGGENDSTNIINHPAATGITTLGFDHMGVLGDTLERIAWHKAGIFKENVPAFTVQQDSTAYEVLQQRCHEKRVAGNLTVVSEELVEGYGITVVPDRAYQKRNAALAIALCEACLKAVDPSFCMTTDIACVLERTQLPGRNEIYREGQRSWLLNSAHNEISMHEASMWFKEMLEQPELANKPRVLLFGHESWRDSEALLGRLHNILCSQSEGFDDVVFCSHQSGIDDEKPDLFDSRIDRSVALETLNRHAVKWLSLSGQDPAIINTVRDAIEFIKEKHKEATVVVAGHLYLTGIVRFILDTKLSQL